MPAKKLSPEQLKDAARLEEIFFSRQRENHDLTQESAAHACGWKTQGAVNQYIKGKIPLNLKALLKFSKLLNVAPELISPQLAATISSGIPKNNTSEISYPGIPVLSANETDLETGKIEYWSAKGSCGGGVMNYEDASKGFLIKEISFFQRYALNPKNSFAIYADGNSMADFIVDGDIVIFDKSKIEPRSGKIFAIDHPDGLRIKRLRREIDGTWVLESINSDKQAFPDERISEKNASLLKIYGQFVYRQGG